MLDESVLSQLTEDDIKALNDFEGYLEFIPTETWYWLINCPCKIKCLFYGNQKGKNEEVTMDYYLRIWGKHPQAHLNIRPEDKIRTIRFASENLPGDNENEEVRNTQYPVLKRRFNPSWLLKDITARKSVVGLQPQIPKILSDGQKWHQKPAQIEFVSYGQSTQAQAGVQRRSVWIDESAPKDFFDEQIPRLLAADGDLILSYTPIPGSIGWEFDELYDRARIIYRTFAVRKRIYKRTGIKLPAIQYTDSKDDIAVIMAATDDNPIYAKLAAEKSKRVGREVTAEEYITDMLGLIADEDVIDARRYGLFKQLSGNIFKGFDQRCHVISREKYFPEGLPYEWKHFRGIDWHEATPWACGWVAVSPHDEIFVYNEFNPSPERMVTMEIARVIATRSQDYKFDLNLIDPLSSKIQPNTGLSSLEDLNRLFAEYRKQGIGTGGHWQVWDTKSQKGRDEIRKRLQNAALCGVPFNNEVKKDGITKRLPTIWILDNCTETIKSLKNWRREEWGDRSSLVTKDEKETPQQKWSHFCTMLEGLMKRPEVFAARFGMRQSQREAPQYFRGRQG
jgi:phage terminase large subunit-like protein